LFDFVRGQLWSCGKVQHAEVKEIYDDLIGETAELLDISREQMKSILAGYNTLADFKQKHDEDNNDKGGGNNCLDNEINSL
jgi:hypothetical protein